MSYAETSAYRGAAGDLQFRGHAVHGVRIVSKRDPTYLRIQ
jgi:hypothetical protein